jgi:DTW domain-containing protein YfiP
VTREARPICGRCRRPTKVCYCAALPRLETRTRVVILQHPRERDMPIGTARMASLALPGASLRVGMQWTADQLADVLGDRERPPILLYPGAGARDILREPPRGPVTLVCVDGTWSQARGIVNRSPVLQALPRYAFAAPEPSHYRIRKEPDDAYVSTIEALMHVLGVLEEDPSRVRALLDPFHAMVDAQLAAQAMAPRRASYRRPREVREPSPRLPPELVARWTDVVCLVAEANAWPRRGEHASRPDELIQVALHRPSTGETTSMIVAPAGELAPSTLFHTGLDEHLLRAGRSRDDVLAALALRPNELVCGWGHYAIELAGATADRLDLRSAAQRREQRKVGSLEDYARSLGMAPASLAPGRAGRRLAILVELVHAWRSISMSSTIGR